MRHWTALLILLLSAPAMAEDRLALLERVNREVNAIPYRADAPGVDVWGGNWDCEEYAIEKRRRLVAAGVSNDAMAYKGLRIAGGVGHAVLVIDPGTPDALVLDSRHDSVVPAWAYGPELTRAIWPSLADLLP